MSRLTGSIHTHTPTLTVIDPRGLAVRSVAYCRSIETAEAEERINRSAYDAMGRLIEQWDPRLWALSAQDAATPASLTHGYSLSGKVLDSISIDAGERISLFGDGDQLVQTWDSRGSERRVEYDNLLRPLAIFEQGDGEAQYCTERYEYADAGAGFAAHNQCGQLIRHDDPAGTQTLDEYALTGGVFEQTQRFLSALDIPDWPSGLPERDALLEPVMQAATRSSCFNPLGDVLEQVDAKGNRQLFDYTADGQLLASHLQLSGQATPQTLVSAVAYSAYGQVEQETAGNGVVSTLTYRPEDGRLIRLEARRGTEAALQDLYYDYDPVGNVLSIEDAALPIRFFANQRVEPIKRYGYDSLYQLIDATGWEAGSTNRGPGFNRFDDPGAVANYHQTYRYDTGGNLLALTHVGPQSHSRKLTAARYSNRCLPEHNDRPPTEDEIAAAFDGNGNLLELQPGQTMSWDLRNQLREVRPVERESTDDDRELYLYGGDGMRRRKVRSTQTNARSLISEVRYLPSLEIRTREGTGEVLQVICVQAGRSAMQVLHWETAPPSSIANDQYRYNLTDHLGSSSLELDSDAEVISQETYHPYGSTAWFAGRSEVEAGYKTVRYSGKEQDATGLYYYGFRYYVPWLQRWVNPDPAGSVDGLNVYGMVRNNPLIWVDDKGAFPVISWLQRRQERAAFESKLVQKDGMEILSGGMKSIQKKYPELAGLITTGFSEAEQVLNDALSSLSQRSLHDPKDDGGVYGLLQNFIGDRSEEAAVQVERELIELRQALTKYNRGNTDDVTLIRSPREPNLRGLTNKKSGDRMIYLNADNLGTLGSSPVVLTLIHEVSHLALDTEDYWYLPSDANEIQLQDAMEKSSRMISGEAYFYDFDGTQAGNKESLADMNAAQANSRQFAKKNADTLTYLAVGLAALSRGSVPKPIVVEHRSGRVFPH